MSEAVAQAEMVEAERRFSYADVEDAMLDVFGVSEPRRGALRGILKAFGQYEIFPALGKGSRRAYLAADVVKIALALRVHALGVIPSLTPSLVTRPDVEHGISASLAGARVRMHLFRDVGEEGFRALVHEGNISTFDDSICINVTRLAERVSRALSAEAANASS